MNIVQEIHALADKLTAEGRVPEARSALTQLSLECLNVLSALMFPQDQDYDEVVRLLKISGDIDKKQWISHSNLSHILNSMCRFDEAKLSAEKALELTDHSSPDVHYNLGVILGNLGKNQEAADSFRRGLLLKPDYAAMHYSLALVLFRLGRWAEAWQEYEYRLVAFPHVVAFRQRYAGSDWSGAEDIKGKTVLVYNEQGLGDFINFSRYFRHLKMLGAKVIVEVQKELIPLYEKDKNVDVLIARESEHPYGDHDLPPYHYVLSVSSIPSRFGASQQGIPDQPKLKPPKKLKKFTCKKGVKKIGLCYAGSRYHQLDLVRSIRLKEFAPLLEIPGSQTFLLQKHDPERVWPGVGKVNLLEGDNGGFIDLNEKIKDYGDLADVIAKMDVVVSVDTGVAHLAGAMGKETYVLIPSLADWRWGIKQETTPWYPSMRLVWQDKLFDWGGPIAKITETLAK